MPSSILSKSKQASIYLLLAIFLLGLVVIPFYSSFVYLSFDSKGLFFEKEKEICFIVFGIWLVSFYSFPDKKLFLKASVYSIIVSSLAYVFSVLSYDLSFDGQGYHQEAIFKIANGWNYLFEASPENPSAIWINHYPKAQWLSASFYYNLLSSIEGAKFIHLLLIFSSFFLGISFIKSFLSTTKTIGLVLCLLMAFDPINLNTLLSHTSDGHVSSLLLILVLLYLGYYKSSSKFLLFLIGLVTVYTMNVKFNAFLYSIFIHAFFIIFFFVKSFPKIKHVVSVSLFSFVLGLFLFGFQPYIKNHINKGHVFYPVYGHNNNLNKELGQDYLPSNMKGKSNLGKLLISSFSSTSFSQNFQKPTHIKWPFSISKYELTRYAGTGVMIGGLGIWFSGLLLISMLVFLYLLANYSKYKIFVFAILAIVCTLIFNPMAWWFRFVPQFWFVAVLTCIALLKSEKTKRLGLIFLILICINSFLMGGYFVYNIYETSRIKKQLIELSDLQKSNPASYPVSFGRHKASFEEKLKTNNISFIEVESLSDLNCVEIRSFKLIESKICRRAM